MREEILKQIQNHLFHELDIERAKVTEDSHLLNDHGVDSLDKINLVMKMEAVFDIHIADELIDDMHKVSDVINVVQKLKR